MRTSANTKTLATLGLLGGALFQGASAQEAPAPESPKRAPNIVMILADDLGWSDTTLFGTTKLYQTPNVQKLAARGMLYTRAYAASPLCSPTRASIMTGLSPARLGFTAPAGHAKPVILQQSAGKTSAPGNKATNNNSVTRLDTKYLTLPEVLKQKGYATGHFGKWHLGPEPYSPLENGFDVDIPHWPGPGPSGGFIAPWKFPTFKENYAGEHIEDRMAEEASAWMEKNTDKPFFLNYWQFSVHAPFDAKADVIRKYVPLVDPNDPQHSPTYAAMVESFDDAVGTLMDALDRLKLSDNTLILFTSDNGGNMYDLVDNARPTSNAPLRGGKATMYEGGIRVPWIVAWPGVVKPASQSEQIVQTTDIYPTLIEAAGLSIPPNLAIDGVDIAPTWQGKRLDREGIYTYFPHSPDVPDWLPPSVSLIEGDWKLIRLFYEGEDGAHGYRLYNLKTDIGERDNRADAEAARVQRMDAKLEAYLQAHKAVLPARNPNFDPAQYKPEAIGISKRKAPAKK